MPLREKVIDFEEERERIQDKMETLADQQVELQEKGREERVEELLIQGNELNNQYNIFEHLAEEWDVDSITLAGLTAGEVNRVEDTVADDPTLKERDAWVAIGTLDAPYVNHNPEAINQSEYETTCAAVTDLPLPFVRWAEGRISELSHLSQEMGNGYIELVQEKQTG